MSLLTTIGALIGFLTLVTTLGLLITLKQAGRSSETEDDPAPKKIPPGGAPNNLPALLMPELAMLETELHFLRESFGNIESLCGLFQETLLAAKDNRLDKKLLDKADETARRLDMEYLKSEVPKALRESLQTLKRIQTLIS